jgi:hypothetical protein
VVIFFDPLVSENPTKVPRSERFTSFDVTQLVKTLSAHDKLTETPTLTIVPDVEPVSASKPLIGEISLVEHSLCMLRGPPEAVEG